MKKTMSIFGAMMLAFVFMTSCGSKWDKLASKANLTSEDVKKAIEIGTKMGDCYQLESKPGAMDSKMTDACDPYMKEYKDYCIEKFGTDDFLGDSPEIIKVKAFREIMFSTREESAKAKQSK